MTTNDSFAEIMNHNCRLHLFCFNKFLQLVEEIFVHFTILSISFLANLILIVFKDGKQYNSFCDKQKREAWLQIVCDKSGKVSFKVFKQFSRLTCKVNHGARLLFQS